jgi:hypothetical protein
MSKLLYHNTSNFTTYKNIPTSININNYGYIYIVYNISYSGFNYENPFKIGRTNNPIKRINQHNCSQIINCEYVFISEVCTNYIQADRLIKQNLRKNKINRELYNIKLDDAKEIIN